MDDAAVPAVVVEQVEDLLETAARRGHALPRPALELPAATDDRTQGIPETSGPGRLVLATDVLTAAPAAQRWAIAHELAHLHPDDLAWLVDVEGPRARRRPTPLRGHPHPARRRQAGLDTLT